ncbi:hypothetical protein H1D24_13350 [Streptomyces sp. PSKA28]|uniref:Uncharacterized protein n=1 Tax=Streptomyces himalayensis subsp. himalayensis TaxID=2756131 RepID=A0A7W0DLE2_9ACTN|nr:hypothetical protein [Streptomyces himalayensis subsp. himalayensis]
MPRSRCGTSSTARPATCPAAWVGVASSSVSVLGQPACDPLGDDELLQLIVHLL